LATPLTWLALTLLLPAPLTLLALTLPLTLLALTLALTLLALTLALPLLARLRTPSARIRGLATA
jgi:hypothetical protein